jgi:hypothetical protein
MTYTPMKNDRCEFDSMGQEWGYILDDGPGEQSWRSMVPLAERAFTWPYQLHTDRHGQRSYGSARLAPDWCFYSWHPEYVLASWGPEAPHLVQCRLWFARRYTSPGPELRDVTGVVMLNLLHQSYTWAPCKRDELRGVPGDIVAEVAHKAGKLLAFFRSECEHWRAGDQPRPAQAWNLAHPDD